MLFLEASKENLATLQWILIGFENISGMKMFYAKCELIPLNIPIELGQTLADQVGCKLGSLPITYLGIPLHYKNITVKDWYFLIEKKENKLNLCLYNYIDYKKYIGHAYTIVELVIKQRHLIDQSTLLLIKNVEFFFFIN